jgi:zinc protease
VLKPEGLALAAGAVAPPEKVSEVRKIVLDNGVRVLLKRIPDISTVSIQAYFLGGVRFEDESQAGLSLLSAQMLLKGTEKRSALEIAQTLEARGGEINASSGNNTFYLTVRVLKEDYPLGIEILADCIKNPTFPEEELEKVCQRTLTALAAQKDDIFSIALRFFRANFFKVSPYSKVPLGTEETVANFTRRDLVSFHSRYAHPANMVLAIFGDIDLAEAEQTVREKFADFQGRTTLSLPQVASEPRLAEDKRIQTATQKEEAIVYMGFPGMSFEMKEDRYAMEVLDAVISGINYPGGWLHNELRGKGLVYVVHAYNFVGLEPGYFGIYALTQPETVDEVVRVVDKAVERIKTQDVGLDEFKRAKNICITNFVMRHQRAGDCAREAALNELYGLGYDFADDYMEGITAVEPEDIRNIAQQYLTHRLVAVTLPEPDLDKKEN